MRLPICWDGLCCACISLLRSRNFLAAFFLQNAQKLLLLGCYFREASFAKIDTAVHSFLHMPQEAPYVETLLGGMQQKLLLCESFDKKLLLLGRETSCSRFIKHVCSLATLNPINSLIKLLANYLVITQNDPAHSKLSDGVNNSILAKIAETVLLRNTPGVSKPSQVSPKFTTSSWWVGNVYFPHSFFEW